MKALSSKKIHSHVVSGRFLTVVSPLSLAVKSDEGYVEGRAGYRLTR